MTESGGISVHPLLSLSANLVTDVFTRYGVLVRLLQEVLVDWRRLVADLSRQ